MPSQSELDRERDNRLIEWIKSEPQAWEDIKSIIEICIDNAKNPLKSISCTEVDFRRGEWSMGDILINSIESYKDREVVKDGESEAQTSS